MKVYYLCASIPALHIRGTRDKGMLWLYASMRAITQREWLVVMLMYCSIFTMAYAADNDSLACEHVNNQAVNTANGRTFHARQLVLPSALIAVGTYGVYNGWFGSVRNTLRNDIGHMRGSCYFHADDYLQYLPVTANVTMGTLGVKSRHRLKDRLTVTATAYAAMGIMVNVGKYTVKERRPDSNARNSFPSGHTATAFMGAELVREEYGGAYGWGAYTVATGIAALRLYNERHWLNDVIAGAGVGILSARIGYWLLPAERRLFGWNEEKTVIVTPMLDTTGNNYGISMTIGL